MLQQTLPCENSEDKTLKNNMAQLVRDKAKKWRKR